MLVLQKGNRLKQGKGWAQCQPARLWCTCPGTWLTPASALLLCRPALPGGTFSGGRCLFLSPETPSSEPIWQGGLAGLAALGQGRVLAQELGGAGVVPWLRPLADPEGPASSWCLWR